MHYFSNEQEDAFKPRFKNRRIWPNIG